MIALVFSLLLAQRSCATFSTNQKIKNSRNLLADPHVSVLGAGYMYVL